MNEEPTEKNVREVRGVKIEAGVEKPTRGVIGQWPIEAMKVGESILLHDATPAVAVSLRKAAKQKFPDRTYDVRKLLDGNYRIWRDA